ncbi:MAG: YraN family protein [Firmicutes bacterium]|nr:YraN family protein [Bacillota bacterium]
MSKRLVGQMGEEAALSYLLKNGYRLLARNFRCRLGEIDLITADGEHIVFVEVRARTSNLFGSPLESVTDRKQVRVRRVAEYFILRRGLAYHQVRFDVVSVQLNADGQVKHIQHIKGAF